MCDNSSKGKLRCELVYRYANSRFILSFTDYSAKLQTVCWTTLSWHNILLLQYNSKFNAINHCNQSIASLFLFLFFFWKRKKELKYSTLEIINYPRMNRNNAEKKMRKSNNKQLSKLVLIEFIPSPSFWISSLFSGSPQCSLHFSLLIQKIFRD